MGSRRLRYISVGKGKYGVGELDNITRVTKKYCMVRNSLGVKQKEQHSSLSIHPPNNDELRRIVMGSTYVNAAAPRAPQPPDNKVAVAPSPNGQLTATRTGHDVSTGG